MEPYLNGVAAAANHIGTIANWPTVGALVSIAAFAMGVLQVVKDLSPLRRWFQRRWIARWIATRMFSVGEEIFMRLLRSLETRWSPVLVSNELVSLATGGDENALYDLPAEQLSAQLSAAAQIILENPADYAPSLIVLAYGARNSDLFRLIEASSAEEIGSREYLDARNRIGHRLQRNLDGLQISLGNSWKFWMQLASISLTVVILELGVWFTPEAASTGTFVTAFVIGVVSGYLAPIARDLLAALQSLRRA